MEHRLALFFLSFYYLRPQDWVPGMAGMNIVKPLIAIWLVVLFTARSRASPLPGLLRTPHDWTILAYFGYVVWNAPDSQEAFNGFLSLAAFYALTVQSVTSWDQLYRYLRWWNLMLLAVAAMALLSLAGIDLTGAAPLTERNLGRLCLGTWLANNPNALAHTVIAAIPLSYLLFFWKGDVFGRFVAFPLCFLLAGACAWHTESKGAFLVGGVLVVLLFVVGRHWIIQMMALVLAATAGVSALNFLPRMADINSMRADEGVMGRVMAWEIARTVTRNQPTGEGWGQFRALIDWQDGARFYKDIPKATHSSYVQVGGDLGKYGLFLYLAAMWAAFRTTLALKTRNDLEERCRRALMFLLAAYAMSGWMINRQYHTEYFLIIAAAAAMHRMRKGEELEALHLAGATAGDREAPMSPDAPHAPGASPPPRGSGAWLPAPAYIRPAAEPEGGPEEKPPPSPPPLSGRKPLWNRFGILDLAATLAATWAVFWFWDYVLGMF